MPAASSSSSSLSSLPSKKPARERPYWCMPVPLWETWKAQAPSSWSDFCAMDVDVNARDDEGWSPLRWAVHTNNHEVMNRLIQANVSFDDETKENGWILEQAFVERREPMVMDLLKAGAGMPPHLMGACLHYSLERLSALSEPLIDALLDHGAKADALSLGRTVLHTLVRGLARYTPFGHDVQRRLTQTLIDHGAPLDVQDPKTGCTALLEAVRNSERSSALIEALIDAGANPNLLDRQGFGWTLNHQGRPLPVEKTVVWERRCLERLTDRTIPFARSSPSRPRL